MPITGISYPKAVKVALPTGKNGKQKQQTMYKDPNGRVTTREQAFMAFEGKVKSQNNAVIAHEMAHNRGAGPQAIGMPHYNIANINGHSVIVGGHQNVAVPAEIGFMASKPQIEKTMRAAEHTIAGAEAPAGLGGRAGELSAADKSVAARGRAVLSAAKMAFGKRQDIEARLAKVNGEVPQGKLTSSKVEKSKQGAPVVGGKLNIVG